MAWQRGCSGAQIIHLSLRADCFSKSEIYFAPLIAPNAAIGLLINL